MLPDYIATQYAAQVTGFDEQLVDYYVEAIDTKGNIEKSPIQHVYVGKTTNTGGGGTTGNVSWTPENPGQDQTITITVSGATQGAKLHWGVKTNGLNWQTPDPEYWPSGSLLFNGVGPAIESSMTGPDGQGILSIKIGPFNNPNQLAEGIDFVLHYNDNTWNNNNGQDFHIAIGSGGGTTQTVWWMPTNPVNTDFITITMSGATQSAKLNWGVKTNGQNWQLPAEDYRPLGTNLYNGTGPRVETPMTGPDNNGMISIQLGPFTNAAQIVEGLDFEIHFADDTWNNNNGQGFHIAISNQGGGTESVAWFPQNPSTNEQITISVYNANKAGKLNWGVNNWVSPIAAYWPVSSELFNGTGPSVESPMNGPDNNGQITLKLGPFNNPGQNVQSIDFVIHYNDNTWNNNNNQDYHIAISPGAGMNEDPLPLFMVYPNPVKDVCFVRNFSENISSKILLTSITGQVLREYILTDKKTSLDLKDLQKGVYLLKFKNDEDQIFTTKLLKL
jgi:hypothetical protein